MGQAASLFISRFDAYILKSSEGIFYYLVHEEIKEEWRGEEPCRTPLVISNEHVYP